LVKKNLIDESIVLTDINRDINVSSFKIVIIEHIYNIILDKSIHTNEDDLISANKTNSR
jgi:hypothetical protein